MAPEPLAPGEVIFDPEALADDEPRRANWVVGSPDDRLGALCLMHDNSPDVVSAVAVEPLAFIMRAPALYTP